MKTCTLETAMLHAHRQSQVQTWVTDYKVTSHRSGRAALRLVASRSGISRVADLEDMGLTQCPQTLADFLDNPNGFETLRDLVARVDDAVAERNERERPLVVIESLLRGDSPNRNLAVLGLAPFTPRESATLQRTLADHVASLLVDMESAPA